MRFALLLIFTACAPHLADQLIPGRDSMSDGGTAELDAGIDAGPTCGCEAWGNARSLGAVAAPLDELSGLTASRSQPGLFFAHNDSGDRPRFFALSNTAQVLETFNLTGAMARDWEDMASGPCPSGTCLFLGDIGDNNRVRTDYAVYRVPEPNVTTGSVDVPFEKLAFQYPDGASRNAEALLMNPRTGDLYIITKETFGPSEVYRFPLRLDPASKVSLVKVTTLEFPLNTDQPVTAADVNPCGTAVLVRMYNRLVELRLPQGETDFEKIFEVTPVTVPSASEGQGEAVAYGVDGQTYFTSSEKLVDDPPLYEYRCR